MLQFWNMFNAKAFASNKSALASLWKCSGFIGVGLLIIVGQIVIVTFGGEMFNVTPLAVKDWWLIILYTMPVLIIGEFGRLIIRLYKQIKNLK